MLDQEAIKKQLEKWMVEFVEQPNPLLNNWAPCPYARAARLNNKIAIKFCEVGEFISVIRDSYTDLEDKDVVVICFDHYTIDPVSLQEWVESTNTTIMKENYVVLEDHPDAPEYINGVCMNFGQCGLLILSKLDKLNDASDKIREKGYYNSWEQKNVDNVVSWRYHEVR